MSHRFWILGVSLLLAVFCRAGESVIQDSQGMPCYVYTPDSINPSVVYQLVVGVHGANGNGKGAVGMAGWAQRGDVVVIGPSFQTKGDRPYQSGDGVHAEKLIALFGQLRKEYQLRDTIFLHGFSGGSQFSHRFAMNHPDLVCGVSAHSGGSWATDGYGAINKKAKGIPFAISCGENDTGMAWGEAPYNRITWYGRFRDELDKQGFCFIGDTWPGVGHRISPGAWDLCRQAFQIATGLPGKSATEMVELSSGWKNVNRVKQSTPAAQRAAEPTKAAISTEAIRMMDAAIHMASEGQIEDEKLIHFMNQYPPVLWKDRPGSAKLLAQCQRAAKAWRQKAIDAKEWSGDAQRRFKRFSEGLGVEEEVSP